MTFRTQWNEAFYKPECKPKRNIANDETILSAIRMGAATTADIANEVGLGKNSTILRLYRLEQKGLIVGARSPGVMAVWRIVK